VTEEEGGFDFREYWRVIRKHGWLISALFLGALFITACVLFRMTPLYTAESTLLIERKTPQVLDVQQAVSESLVSDEYDYYKTQYEILKNRALAAQVILEQRLEQHRLFSRTDQPVGGVNNLWSTVKTWVNLEHWMSWTSGQERQTKEDLSLGVRPEIINAYLGMLEIKPVEHTRLVKIALSTPDPDLSARLANAHTQAYIQQGVALRSRANEEALRFLEAKLGELKERMEQAEATLNNYRRDKGIISLDEKENIVVERLADLNKRVTEAEAERIGLEAQVQLIRKRNYDSLPAVISSTLIQTLKEQVARLEGESAQMAAQFKTGYPRLAQLQAQVTETRERLKYEIQHVVGGIESAYLAAEARERELRAKMEQQKEMTLRLKDAAVEYALLAREAETNRQLYDSVLQRMKEMGVAAELRASNVSIIEQAEPPLTPSKPKKPLTLFLSACLGLIGGVGLAFFFEHLDNTLKTPEEVERVLGLPNLGVVPDFLSLHGRSYGYAPHQVLDKDGSVRQLMEKRENGTARDGLKILAYVPPREPGKELLVVSHHPLSVVAEAYRSLRTGILLSRAAAPPKTILFTSGTQAEGKTSTTINTAVIFAQMGVKVLVIDADLRRPRCHKVLGMSHRLGLTEVLTGQRGPLEMIRSTNIDNLFLLGSGAIPPNPAELVGSKRMRELLASLQEVYDYILIDSPPVMPISDAVLLSTFVDGVVLVVGGQQTPKHVIKETCSRLEYAQAKILGVALNRVNMQSGDYAYYYRDYYSYYHHAEAEHVA
jgi:capsular exopolysaccharide synthesis family protein